MTPGAKEFGSPVAKKKVVPIIAVIIALLLLIFAYNTLTSTKKVYGLMIDAGSTGSRMHTFIFSEGPDGELKLIGEDFHPIKPGLSAYKDDPLAAGKSLIPLLEKSKQIIPKDAHKTTPVFLRATAGLRMLGPELSEKILDNARETLSKSDFRFDDKSWAKVLEGNDEGIYTWITINYLLGRRAGETAGTLEMGGGSSQVAFVPQTELEGECQVASESIDYKGEKMGLYTVSHLGFGLKKAKADIMKAIVSQKKDIDSNPCLSNGKQNVEIPFEDPPMVVEMTGAGSFAACTALVDGTLMDGAGSCDCGLCTYQKKAQPSAAKDYVALAFYAERSIDLGLKNPVSMKDIRTLGEEICKMDVEAVRTKYPVVANGDATDLCFDLSFIYKHLSEGHGIVEAKNEGDQEPKITMAKQLNGVELGWSLGAMFAELSKLNRA